MALSLDSEATDSGFEIAAIKTNNPPNLTLVVPCYNEENGLLTTATTLLDVLSTLQASGQVNDDSRLCMVDDGSADNTWEVIQSLAGSDERCCGLRLSRNFGHQNALLAGLLSCPGDALISMDADLQDDPTIIGQMLDAHRDGAEIVFAARDDRTVDSFWKKAPAKLYYKLMAMMGATIIEDHADYRLMGRRSIESLREHREVNLCLRALVPQLGYSQAVVKYKRQPRVAGETKYTLGKLVALALNGITASSVVPLRLIALVGFIVFLGSVVIATWALWIRLFTDSAVPGWASSVVPMYLLGGIQLLSIAVVGEYVAKLYMEAKSRPKFLLRETLGMGTKAAGTPVRRQAGLPR